MWRVREEKENTVVSKIKEEERERGGKNLEMLCLELTIMCLFTFDIEIRQWNFLRNVVIPNRKVFFCKEYTSNFSVRTDQCT